MAWWAIPAAIGAASAIFGKKNKVQAPAPAPKAPPKPKAPPAPAKPRDIKAPGVLQNPSLYADPMQGVLGRQVQGQVASGQGLSDQYRNAILGNIQAQLDLSRNRSFDSMAEKMNAMGLLGSGAVGVHAGMMDQEHMRGMLGAQSMLAQQDIQEKARLQNLLMGLQQDSSARTRYLASLGLQHSGMQNQSDLNYAGLLSNHQLGVRGQDMDYNRMGYQGQLAQYDATNQANMMNAQLGQSRQNAIFGNLMQLPYAYQANQMMQGFNQQSPMGRPTQSVGSNQRYQLPALKRFGGY